MSHITDQRSRIVIETTGARGESFADAARRTGAFGALPGDSDAVIMARLTEYYSAISGTYYPTVGAGEAATVEGEAFAVATGDGTVTWYRRTAGGSDEIFQSDFGLRADLADETGAALIGTDGGGTVQDAVAAIPFSGGFRRPLDPLYLETFATMHHGRGMLAAEPEFAVTEQAIATSSPAGGQFVHLTSATGFAVGGSVTVRHDNGRYWTYFITQLSGNNLTVRPALKWAATAGVAMAERTWLDAPHVGNYGMRQVGQMIAHAREYELAVATEGRIIFTNFGTEDLVSVNGAGVSYIASANTGQGFPQFNVDNLMNRAGIISFDASGEGARTAFFDTHSHTSAILRVALAARTLRCDVRMRVINEDGDTLFQHLITDRTSLEAVQFYTFPIHLAGDAGRVAVEITAQDISAAGIILVNQIELFPSNAGSGPIIKGGDGRPPVIVGAGHSWVAGAAGRESILEQLARELPRATIINEGVGGRRIDQLNASFDAEVAPHNPDYVVICIGVNDAYNPPSAVFDPNGIDEFCRSLQEIMAKCKAIGARPIVVGMPALAESDGAFEDYLLNDRARAYNWNFQERLSSTLGSGLSDSYQTWTPELFIGGSSAGITYGSRSGRYYKVGRMITFDLAVTLTSKGTNTGLLTLSLPWATAGAGHVVMCPTLLFNVADAAGAVAVINIGGVGTARLHKATATGNATMNETSLTDTSTIQVSGTYIATS